MTPAAACAAPAKASVETARPARAVPIRLKVRALMRCSHGEWPPVPRHEAKRVTLTPREQAQSAVAPGTWQGPRRPGLDRGPQTPGQRPPDAHTCPAQVVVRMGWLIGRVLFAGRLTVLRLATIHLRVPLPTPSSDLPACSGGPP